MNYKDKRVLVVGGGLSGIAAAKKLLLLGAEVFLTDRQEKDKLPGIKELEELGLDPGHLLLAQEPPIAEIRPDLLVLSPGVPPHQPFIQQAAAQGIPIWSEVELALRGSLAQIVGITGSNGKTTTASLCGELAKASGRDTVVAGNIGLALCGQVEHLDEQGIIVAELSSFQLELIDKVRINIAVILNLTPDHLDRHGTMENYIAAKARILENQTPEDLAILNWDDLKVRELAPLTKARVVFFSSGQPLDDGIFVEGEDIIIGRDYKFGGGGQGFGLAEAQAGTKGWKIVSSGELLLRGRHNLENVMAAVAVALELGLKKGQIVRVLRSFQPVKHRQEIVGKYNGILFINDSKGTNPESSIRALQAYEEPIVLIAGGRNKGLDMTAFLLEAKKRVKSLVLVGEAASELEILSKKIGIKRVLRSSSFEDCVAKAIAEAEPGDVVLLSPACTSWDMFKSYEERGELFKELVRKHYSEPKSF